MAHLQYKTRPRGIVVLVFIKTNIQSKLIKATTMIHCRGISKQKLAIRTLSDLVLLLIGSLNGTQFCGSLCSVALLCFPSPHVTDSKPIQFGSCLQLFILQAAVVTEGVARWEDNKKWQQKVETLRGKLAEKTRELEKAEKTITMLRDAVSRAEKDKAGLHNRLKRYCFDETIFNEMIFNEQFTCDESLFLYSFLHSLLVVVLPKQWLVVRLWSQTKLYRTLNRTCTSWKKRYQNYYLQQLGFSNSP